MQEQLKALLISADFWVQSKDGFLDILESVSENNRNCQTIF